LTLTNSFHAGDSGVHRQRVRYVRDLECEVNEEFEYHALNVEAERFPFDDGSFDVVLFCEVIEHLLLDPVTALSEMHRVLKVGGTLVVTTPNLARLENVGRLAAGANIYDPYSGYGPYGRHNREFIRHELIQLLEFTGFSPTSHFTADVHSHATANFIDPARLAGLVEHRLPDLGQYIFCAATKTHSPRDGRPSELFRSMSGQDLVSWQ
jgi:SAM-dependent methyltransferase